MWPCWRSAFGLWWVARSNSCNTSQMSEAPTAGACYWRQGRLRGSWFPDNSLISAKANELGRQRPSFFVARTPRPEAKPRSGVNASAISLIAPCRLSDRATVRHVPRNPHPSYAARQINFPRFQFERKERQDKLACPGAVPASNAKRQTLSGSSKSSDEGANRRSRSLRGPLSPNRASSGPLGSRKLPRRRARPIRRRPMSTMSVLAGWIELELRPRRV